MRTPPIRWLADRWVACAAFMASALLAFTPVFAHLPLALFLLALHSPAYMLHQVEEHAHDRFRRFTNLHVFGGREALTTPAVLIINLPLVWGLNLGAFYAGYLIAPAWGLAAPYCLIVNAVAHIAATLRLRLYNPGLITALLLFLPLGTTTLYITPDKTLTTHLTGLGIALGLHIGIVLAVLAHLRRLRRP